jgi:hypothetical protein
MKRRFWFAGAVFVGLIGCLPIKNGSLLPLDGDHPKEPEVKTIGDVSTVANADPIPVSGVGLVVGLEGTGGSAPPGAYRNMLEKDLQQKGAEHVKEILASPQTSMVLVSALIPAGAKKDDPLDVDITLPPGSKTTSLRGGYLKESCLFNYNSTKNLDPDYKGADRQLLGHVLARAEGPLLTGVAEGDDSSKLKIARIWGGAKSLIERPFYIILNSDHQSAPVAQRVADRVNQTYHGATQNDLTDVAHAKTKSLILLKVPIQYRYNLPHYLRVVRLIPLAEIPPGPNPYRNKLSEQMLDPAHTISAALRLEALGNDSIPLLKKGLKSEHPLVRFASAEALAYLGDPACGDELAKLVEHQPMLRAYCLTAMASLDEAITHVKLRELMSSPTAATRYGAFRALRSLDERDPAVQGELLNGSYWVHRAAPLSPPLIHVSSTRRAEIVLFGEDPTLVPPFSYLAGEFTITAARDDTKCTISRLSVHHGSGRRQCSLKVEEVLHQMADMGAMYPEAVDFLGQAGTYQTLNCSVAVDALPWAVSVQELAQNSARQSDLLKTDEEIVNAQKDFGATPTLYDRPALKRPSSSPSPEEHKTQNQEMQNTESKLQSAK